MKESTYEIRSPKRACALSRIQQRAWTSSQLRRCPKPTWRCKTSSSSTGETKGWARKNTWQTSTQTYLYRGKSLATIHKASGCHSVTCKTKRKLRASRIDKRSLTRVVATSRLTKMKSLRLSQIYTMSNTRPTKWVWALQRRRRVSTSWPSTIIPTSYERTNLLNLAMGQRRTRATVFKPIKWTFSRWISTSRFRMGTSADKRRWYRKWAPTRRMPSFLRTNQRWTMAIPRATRNRP